MALLFQLTPPLRNSSSLHHLKLTPPFPKRHRCFIPVCLNSSNPGATTSHSNRLFPPVLNLVPLYTLKPYLQSQWQPILYGWLCSAISVYSLSQIVPKVGKLSAVVATLDAVKLRNQGFILGVLVLVRIIANYLQQEFLWDAALNSVFKIRVFVYRRVLQRDLGFFEGENGVSAGDIAYRITAEASDVADTINSVLNTIVPCTLQLLAMGTQMLVISPVLSLISVLVIPTVALIVGYLGEKLREISNRAHLSIAALSAYLNEGVGKAYNELKQGEPALEHLFGLTRFTSQVIEQPDSVELDYVQGEVKFSGVSFKYGASTQFLLNGLDLHIKAGETVALVGPSGGGKTTIAKLLLRLYDPISGFIVIDGHDIRAIRLGNLRRHVGLVSQDITLFSGTIAENIGYRDLMAEIDMERVEFAARTANADEFIEALPGGYRTNIGPRGSILSGGQKQRLAIARALYQNPSILILDEATSALDSRSEQQVRRALERLMQNRTVLVIAHRLETVLMAQRILLLDDGKLRELSRSALLDAQNTSLAAMALVI